VCLAFIHQPELRSHPDILMVQSTEVCEFPHRFQLRRLYGAFISVGETWPRMCFLVHSKLLPQRQIFERKILA